MKKDVKELILVIVVLVTFSSCLVSSIHRISKGYWLLEDYFHVVHKVEHFSEDNYWVKSFYKGETNYELIPVEYIIDYKCKIGEEMIRRHHVLDSINSIKCD